MDRTDKTDGNIFEDAQVGVKEPNLERQLISLVFEKDEQIERLTAEVERLSAEKVGEPVVDDEALAEKDGQIAELGARLEKLAEDKAAQSTEIEKLKSELGQLSAERTEKSEQVVEGGLLAEKNEQIEWLNARIKKLASEKEEQGRQIEKLSAEKDELSKRPAAVEAGGAQRFSFESAGSLAEASISVSGVLKAAQDAADLYLQNIKLLEAEKTAAAEKIEEDARTRADAILNDALKRRDELENAEKKALSELRGVSALYMDFLDKSHAALHEMIDRYKITKLAGDN